MKIFVTIFTVCIATLCAKGQQSSPGKFTAKVMDDAKEPLAGVTVKVAGKYSGTVTDDEGNFTVDAGKNDVIQFSYIGFESAEYPVYEIMAGMQNQIQLTGSAFLKEVVITGSVVTSSTYIPICGIMPSRIWPVYLSSDSSQFMSNIPGTLLKPFVFYPNPTIDGVVVQTPEATGLITVFSLDGSRVGQSTVSGPITRVDLSSLPAATYFLYYENEKGRASVGKAVLDKL